MNQSIIACNRHEDIGTRVVLWDEDRGFACPNTRGRKDCTQHDPVLNDQPTRSHPEYQIHDPSAAYEELKQTVHQLMVHYDVCYSSYQCHEIMKHSAFKGAHFYLDVDGTLYQSCDLYWKTNTGPADDRIGNERTVHVEIANLSWEALENESELYKVKRDQYRHRNGRWELIIPEIYRNKIMTPGFKAFAARGYGERGYFSRMINGRMVRMWDFTEEQYQALVRLCIGINKLLPQIKLRVPYNNKTGRIPMDKIKNFSTFKGILGHAHAQAGASPGLGCKYDPGSAFNWSRLRKAFHVKETQKSGKKKPIAKRI